MTGISHGSSNMAVAQQADSESLNIDINRNTGIDPIHERHAASEQPSSWLGQVKGRIAKTVQEKYSEYKQENELRKQAAAAISIPGSASSKPSKQKSQDDGVEDIIDWPKGIIQSIPDGNFSEPCSLSSPAAEKLMSEIYSSDVKGSKSNENLEPNNSTVESKDYISFKYDQSISHKKEEMNLDLNDFGVYENASNISSEATTPIYISNKENPTKSELNEKGQETNISPLQTPERLRRRYLAFPSLYSSFRSNKGASPQPISQISENMDEVVADNLQEVSDGTGIGKSGHGLTSSSTALNSTTTSVSQTPKGSLKNRMWNLMGKSPSSNTITSSSQPVSISSSCMTTDSLTSMSMRELKERSPVEDSYSGFDSTSLLHETKCPSIDSPTTQDDSEVETGLEIGEDFVILQDPDKGSEKGHEITSDHINDSVDAEVVVQVPESYSFWPLENLQYWWMAALPLCCLLLLQISPFPAWVIGFVTGIIMAVPITAYLTYLMFGEYPEPLTPFIENVQKKVAKRPAIIVQEELERKFVWMNLWPTKKGRYDPLTYDVRRTSTVRLMLHGPWIEMRFPKRNLPLRRMHDDVEPKKVDFYDQVEVIDLSTCSIDLLPENLPSKRMWSKKYPIRIRTNMRKQTASNSETSKQMQAKNDNIDLALESETEPTVAVTDEKGHNPAIKIDVANPTPENVLKELDTQLATQPFIEMDPTPPNGTKEYDTNPPQDTADAIGDVQKKTESYADEDYFKDAFDDWASTPSSIPPNSDSENLVATGKHVSGEENSTLRPTSLPVPITGKTLSAHDVPSATSEISPRKDDRSTELNSEQPTYDIKAIEEGSPENEEISTKEEIQNKTFYLFTRTGREKEEWYNRFMVAANFMEDWEHQNPKPGEKIDPNYETQKIREQKFRMFMEDYYQAKNSEVAAEKHKMIKDTPEMIQCAKEEVSFLNVYIARMWHDLHDSNGFLEFLREKLSRKLMKVKIANYFNDVRVTELDLGPKLPQILSSSLPWQDELGLWVNLEIEYNGVCQATVETKGIRLPGKDEPDREAQELLRLFSRQAATMDSDEEDSAEEDDEPLPGDENDGENDIACDKLQPHAGFKARMLDKVLKSDFVAKVSNAISIHYSRWIIIIICYQFFYALFCFFYRLQKANGLRRILPAGTLHCNFSFTSSKEH